METNENIRQENLGIIRQTDFGEFYEQIMEIHQRGEVKMRSYSSFHNENTYADTEEWAPSPEPRDPPRVYRILNRP